MEFELIHHFDCDIASFEKAVYFDEELNKRLLKMPNISDRQVKEIKDEGDHARRLMFIEAAAALPKEVRSILGEKFGWHEVSTLDKKTHTVTFEIQPTVKLPLECKGRYEMIAEGANKVKRVIKGEVKVKIPLLGKTVEKIVVSQLVTSFEQEEKIVRDYLAEIAKK
jgi:hypothetical protein